MSIEKTIQKRYHIKDVLGQGSMGTTYKALDLKTRRSVAVKLLHFSRVQEWKALEMFEREAKILQQLEQYYPFRESLFTLQKIFFLMI